MKGIFKKLFLGLFLCALICAGFSKNVKAATVSGTTVEYAKTTGVKLNVTMDGAGATSESIPLYMDYSDATGTPTTQIGTVDWDGAQWKFIPDGTVGSEYKFNSATSSAEFKLVLEAANSNDQLEAIRGCAQTKYGSDPAIKKVYINVTGSSEGRPVMVVNPEVTVNDPTGIPSAYTSPATKTDFKVDYDYPKTGNNWVVEGESYGYKLVGNTPKGIGYMESAHKRIGSIGHSEVSGYFRDSIDATYSTASCPSITYTYLPVTTIDLDLDFEDIYIIKGKSSDPRKVELDKKVDGSDWKNYSSSNNSEVRLSCTTGSTATPTTLASMNEFTVTPNAAKEYTLTVSVFDTKIDSNIAQKEATFTFEGTTAPTEIAFDPTSFSLKVGETADLAVMCNGIDVTDECDIEVEKTTYADYFGGEIEGKSKGNTNVKADFCWAESSYFEGGTGSAKLSKSAPVKVISGSTGGTLKFSSDPVCVSEGCEVNLADFMSGDKTMYVDLRLEGGIAKLGSKITTPEELKNVKIKGTKAGKKTDGITVWPFDDEDNPVMADLKVYPSPSISTGSSGGFGSFNSSSSSSNAGITVSVPASTYHGGESEWVPSVKYAFVTFGSLSSGKTTTLRGSVSGTTSSDTKTATISLATVSNEIGKIAKGDNDQIYVEVNPEMAESDMLPDKAVSGVGILNAYKIELKGDSATYKVNGESVKDYFYAIADQEYTIESVAKNSGDKFQKWEGDESSTAKIDKIKFSSPRTLHAVYGNSSSSSSSSSSSKLTANGTGTGADSEGLDDVPKTGESKTDIWILWTVLLVSILGAGFMIYRRFGVVNAIAQAQADETAAIEQEKIDAEVKEKEDKLRVLKNLRNLK